jgi:biotin transport system substrate-specific component
MKLITKLKSEGMPVSKELSTQLNPAGRLLAVQPSTALRTAGIVLAGSALVAVCAHLSIPLYFTPVPLSLAPFAVLVIGLFLRPGLAAATLGAYLVEGAMGLPVFAPTPALPGVLHLMGPTGGYLLSYPFAAALIAWLSRRTTRSFSSASLSAAVGSFVILACGAAWMAILTHATAQSIVTLAIVPFLPGDALKVVAAAALFAGWMRTRRTQA